MDTLLVKLGLSLISMTPVCVCLICPAVFAARPRFQGELGAPLALGNMVSSRGSQGCYWPERKPPDLPGGQLAGGQQQGTNTVTSCSLGSATIMHKN